MDTTADPFADDPRLSFDSSRAAAAAAASRPMLPLPFAADDDSANATSALLATTRLPAIPTYPPPDPDRRRWDSHASEDVTDAYGAYRSTSPVSAAAYGASQPEPGMPQSSSGYFDPSEPSTTVGSSRSSPPPQSAEFHQDSLRGRMKRAQTMRRVELVQGNLVVECPVPTKLLNAVPIREGQEFTHMRYTAATTDPDDFVDAGFTLRPALFRRQTELFIVMTMYNEDDVLFTRTMHGVMKNVSHLCSRLKSKTWGREGWQKVVVCIVSDGRKKCNRRVLTVLETMGVYQDGIAKNSVNGKHVTAHIYEFTTQVSVDADLTIVGAEAGIVPVQILFCLKEQNKKKLNSHRWFFNSFAPILNPNVCILLDVGTKPSGTSIYHLWKAFDRNRNIAGACGEICAMLGSKKQNLFNPLVATQNFEYKMSNILDKPLESLFGFISVLPGAFSAYRYKALKDSKPGVGPLSSYFKGEALHGAESSGIFEANMYLAEDRILCFELFAKPKCSWTLHYVKSAKAETDVPDNLPELISQRRRWLNGSFFAAVFAVTHFNQIWSTQHSIFRKIAFLFENIYMSVNLYFSWFALGNFYITFFYLGRAFSQLLFEQNPEGSLLATFSGTIFTFFQRIYYMTIVVIVICSMGNRPQGSTGFYMFATILFAVLMSFMLLSTAFLTYFSVKQSVEVNDVSHLDLDSAFRLAHDSNFRNVAISLLSTWGLYLAASLIHAEPWHMFHSFAQYLLVLPAYINILNIYAFCNVHDVSWGTKGDNTAATDLGAVTVVAGAGGAQVADVTMPTEQVDINRNYEQALLRLKTPAEEEVKSRDAKTKKDDYYRGFRTRLVLAWMLSNGALVNLLTSDAYVEWMSRGTSVFNPYLSFLFWVVAALAALRFVGSAFYLVVRLFFG